MNRSVAQRTCLIFRRLVVSGPRGPLNRKCVTLKTQKVNLAHPQKAGVVGAVRCVATGAAFGLHRNVLVDEWALFVGVTLHTNNITVRHRPNLPHGRRAVRIMVIATLNETLVDPVVIRLREISSCRLVTSVAKARLSPHQKVLLYFCMVRRVTIQAADVTSGVRCSRKMSCLTRFIVAAQATGISLLVCQHFETYDLADIAASLHMFRTRSVTRFASVPVHQCRFEMGSMLKVVFVKIFVACLTGIASNILIQRPLWRRRHLSLCTSHEGRPHYHHDRNRRHSRAQR